MPWTHPKSPFATLSYQISRFIHTNGAEGKISVKGKELNVKQHIPLVLFLHPMRPISWKFDEKLFFHPSSTLSQEASSDSIRKLFGNGTEELSDSLVGLKKNNLENQTQETGDGEPQDV